jgi:hypothetical protein
LIIYKKIFWAIILSGGILLAQTEVDFPKLRLYPSTITQTEPVITVHPSNPLILFTSAVTINVGSGFFSEGVYVSTDGGNTWAGSDTCKGQLIVNHGGDPGVVITESGRFVLSHIGFVFLGMYTHYSDDLGETWSNSATVTDHQISDKGTIRLDYSNESNYNGRIYLAWVDLELNPSAVRTAYSTDDGISWSAPQTINPNPPLRTAGGSITTSREGTVYTTWSGITSSDPFFEDYAGFSISTDGGVSWSTQQNIFDMNGISGTFPSKGNIKVNGLPLIVVDNSGGIRDGWIYILTTEKNLPPAGSDPDIILHKSTDGGQTWSSGIRVNQDALNNGKIQYFPSIQIDDLGGVNILFYDDRNTTSDSTDVFIARSMDGGNTWKEFSLAGSRFEPKPIVGGSSLYQGDHIDLLAVDDKLYAVWMADYSGIYQIWLAIIDRNLLPVETQEELPVSKIALYQNFPNPFNPSTKIRYALSNQQHVSLKIYDMLGNDIKTLVNEFKPAGEYEVGFDAGNLPSGVYFYKLVAGKYVAVKKLLLLR